MLKQDTKNKSSFFKMLKMSLRSLLTPSEKHKEEEEKKSPDETFKGILKDHISDLKKEQIILLKNVLNLQDKPVSDVMIPRADIVSLEHKSTLEDILKTFNDNHLSRLPVYKETLDEVIGFLHIKDIIPHLQKQKKDFKLEKIIRKILFVSPSMRIHDLLFQMRQKRVHLALIVDEYGGVDGLVTIENLVEEIVGEIEDEHDENTNLLFEKKKKGLYIVDARTTLELIEEKLGSFITDEERENIDTLGGLVYSLCERIPSRGEVIKYPDSDVEFEIIDVDLRKIKKLYIRFTLKK